MSTFKTGLLLAALTGLFLAVGYALGGRSGMIIAFLLALGTNAFAYWNSDKMILSTYDAREIERRDAPDFYDLIAELARNAGLPMPRVYVIDSPQPNAFATGRDPQHAAVAATTGLLEMMSREQVAGVMAHELAHVRSRDTLVMTITATIAGAIGMLANLLAFGAMFGGSRDDEEGGGLGTVGALAMMILAPLMASIVPVNIRPMPRAPASAVIRCGWPRRWAGWKKRRIISVIPKPTAILARRICSSSIRSLAAVSTPCFQPIPVWRLASHGSNTWQGLPAAAALRPVGRGADGDAERPLGRPRHPRRRAGQHASAR